MGASVFFFVGWGRDTVLSTEAVLTEGKSESIDIRLGGILIFRTSEGAKEEKRSTTTKARGSSGWNGDPVMQVTKRNVLRPLKDGI